MGNYTQGLWCNAVSLLRAPLMWAVKNKSAAVGAALGGRLFDLYTVEMLNLTSNEKVNELQCWASQQYPQRATKTLRTPCFRHEGATLNEGWTPSEYYRLTASGHPQAVCRRRSASAGLVEFPLCLEF